MWFKREFEWREDQEYGYEGWIMKRMPHFNVVEGFGIAHDVLEHFDYGDELKHEFMAFGAMLYIRAEGGWWHSYARNFHTPAQNMSADISRFLVENAMYVQPCRSTRLDDEWLEDMLAETSEQTYKLVLDEASSELEQGKFSRADVREAIKRALHWMRRGYRKAVKRWHGAQAYHMADLFQSITQEAENHKQGDYGHTLSISVNTRTLEYRVVHREYQDPYAY